MQIGRITGLTEPHDWQSSDDDMVTMTADYQSPGIGGAGDGLVVRRQLLSYPTPDETVIPIVLTSDAAMSGFYRPIRIQILTDQLSRVRGSIFNYQMDLQRVSGFAQPTMEAVLSGALLTNVVGAVATDCWQLQAISNNYVEYAIYQLGGAVIGAVFPITRASADGTMAAFFAEQVAAIIARYYVGPSDHYTGAATFQQGSPLATVVGRGLTQPITTSWQLSNGITKVTPNATPGKLDVAHWKPGGGWAAAKTYKITASGNVTGINGFSSVTVLRNSPEAVVIRLGVIPNTAILPPGRFTLDLLLRRGDVLLRGFLTAIDNPATFGIARDTTEAATAVTFGAATTGGEIRATSNDADGNRYVLMSVQSATTNDLTHGAITQTGTNSTFDFGIGTELGGSGAGAGNAAGSVGQTYIAAGSEEQRIVAR